MLMLMSSDSLVSTYDILLTYGQMPTVGLVENMVYDIIPVVPQATGNTTVNASLYNVECAAVPNARYVSGAQVDPGEPTSVLFFTIDGSDNYEAIFDLPCTRSIRVDDY